MTRIGLVAVLCFAACKGGTSAPSEETYHPAWCRADMRDDMPCIWMFTKDECERQFEHRVECAPLYEFACYGDDDVCFRTLSACESDRARTIANTLKQHRDRIGPCTIYRVKR